MPSLNRAEARTRARLLQIDRYELDFDLTGLLDGDRFRSSTTIRFGCAEPGASTFAELAAEQLVQARLNGVPVSYADGRLQLTDLAAMNELVVVATMAASTAGEGLHRYVDPDGDVYLYAQAGPDLASRLFAAFDQPDLKAPIQLSVTAPAGWTVLANAAGASPAAGRWEFAPTQPISTYLMTLVAGPLHAYNDEHDGIPLGLYSRRALGETLERDAPQIIAATKACFDRYHELFGIRYPFGKYDQVFLAEFNWGAVENPGCVNFREEFLHTSAVTDVEIEQRYVVIAHEMAHMWFGDLVTLAWWDDIWLNESFAEYMGWRVTAETSRFTQAWTSFAVGRKAGGYAADQRPSTHPVAPDDVPDTAAALLNFDGISYAKGASVLRQLVAWLGDEAFLAGLRRYFIAHRYGNASLADFLEALTTASGRDVAGWADVWLRQPQVNTLRLDGDRLLQTAPAEYPTLRPHRIGIAGYRDGRRTGRVELDVNGPATPVLDPPTGAVVLVNDGDLTFAKVRFDAGSQAQLGRELPMIDDSLARAVIWAAAADATRNAELPVPDYLALVANGLPAERHVTVFRDVVAFAVGNAIDRYANPTQRPDFLAAVHAAALFVVAAGDDRLLAAARAGIRTASDPTLLREWLAGQLPTGLVGDAELRWALVYRLAVLGAVGTAEIDDQLASDRSPRGTEHAIRCRAALPTAAAKAEAWAALMGRAGLSGRLMSAAAEGFWQAEHADLTDPYVGQFFAEAPVAPLAANIALPVWSAAFPRLAVSAQTAKLAEAMLLRRDLSQVLRRVATDQTADLRQAIAARR